MPLSACFVFANLKDYLKEYSIFVAKVRKCIKEDKSNVKAAITRAVDECINENILKPIK